MASGNSGSSDPLASGSSDSSDPLASGSSDSSGPSDSLETGGSDPLAGSGGSSGGDYMSQGAEEILKLLEKKNPPADNPKDDLEDLFTSKVLSQSGSQTPESSGSMPMGSSDVATAIGKVRPPNYI